MFPILDIIFLFKKKLYYDLNGGFYILVADASSPSPHQYLPVASSYPPIPLLGIESSLQFTTARQVLFIASISPRTPFPIPPPPLPRHCPQIGS